MHVANAAHAVSLALTKARRELGYEPVIDVDRGLRELASATGD